MRRALLLATALLALTAQGVPLAAAAPRPSFNDIEDEVMCVTCNVPLNIAESPQADQERKVIRDLLARGKSKQQVLDALVASYGDNVLAEPKGKGFDLAAWGVPIGAVAALLVLGAVLLPRWRRGGSGRHGPPAPAGPGLDDVDEQRLQEDLARYDV
jgi:cytochrome c-type biogenesis protein CcmH